VGVNRDVVAAVDGYRFVTPVEPLTTDYDEQGHLNNASTVRLFNDLRIAYIRTRIGERWTNWLQDEAVTVVARELHVLYENEARPGEALIGAVRVAQRSGRSGVVEERLVSADGGRPIASCWVVQLIVQGGSVRDWPDFYWELVAEAEGAPVPVRPSAPRPPWGPPPA
jgi:acyl-CoA thioesterase FadM